MYNRPGLHAERGFRYAMGPREPVYPEDSPQKTTAGGGLSGRGCGRLAAEYGSRRRSSALRNPLRRCVERRGHRIPPSEINFRANIDALKRSGVTEILSLSAVGSLREDLLRGRQRLEFILEDDFVPIFTPPWNRCNANTLQMLKKLDYAAVSRHHGSKPLSPGGLPDFYVNVDLHTRKEPSAAAGWNNLLREFEQAITSRLCGIMIHHQMMNDAAFDFLEILLKALISHKNIKCVNFKDLADLKLRRTSKIEWGFRDLGI